MTARPTSRSSRLAGLLLGSMVVALCVVLSGYLAVRHLLWPRLDEFRPDVVAFVGKQLGRPVSVAALHPAWDGLHPSLRIEGLRLDGPDGESRLSVGAVQASVSWRSLVLGRLRFGSLRLEAPAVLVERLADGRHAIAGFETAGEGGGGGLDWLLQQGEIAVERARVRFVDRTGAFAPVVLDGLDLALSNAGRRHRGQLRITQPGEVAESIGLTGEVYRPPLSAPSDWRLWQGELHASGQGVELARVASLAAGFDALSAVRALQPEGRVDALAWLRFDHATMLDATLKVRAVGLSAALAHGRLAVQSLRSDARAERTREGEFAVRLSGLTATDAGGFVLVGDGDVELGVDGDGALRQARVRLKRFDANAALQAVRRLPLPPSAQQRLAPVSVSGEVRDLALRWQRPAAPGSAHGAETARPRGASPRVELSAAFERLGLQFEPLPDGRRLPGFENLSGTVRAGDQDGQLTLTGRNAALFLPGVFEESTVPFDRLDGGAVWTVDAAGAGPRVEVSRLAFANADLQGVASGQWRPGGNGAGVVDLSGRVERIDARRLPRYMPARVPEFVRDWSRRAMLAGTVEDVRVEVRGDLHDFPFRDPATGRFRMAAAMRDATLAYAPQWPRIEQIRGDLVFEGVGFEVRAQSGVSEGVRLNEVRARLADYHESVLVLDGRGAGPAQDMLAFVDASPLAATVRTFTRDLRVDGDARLAMKLTLPLYEMAAMKVSGSVEFPGNEVLLDRTLPPFSGVVGRMEFDEWGISLPEVRATLLGGPVRVEARRIGDGRLRVDATGSIDAAGMRGLVDNPLTRRLDGRTDYRAVVEVDRRASSVLIESDLVGLSSTLPPPFRKASAEPWPLRVHSQPLAPPDPAARPPGDRLDVRLRDDIAFAIERERDPASERLLIRRAGFAVDAEPVLRDGGLSVLVRTPAIDLDAWRAVLGDGELERLERSAGGGASAGMSLVPDLVSVVADDLRIGGRDLHEVVVGASRIGGRWRANIASREIVGHFEWRDPRLGERVGTLTARFARLELPRSREGEVESALSAAPSSLPGLDVSVDELVLGRLPMGSLTLSATNGGTAEQPIWTLDRLVVANDAARLEAKGSWSFGGAAGRGAAVADPAARRSTALDFELRIEDAGRLLARMGLKDTMRGSAGALAGQVHWNGSPLAIDYPSLDGAMTLSLGRGEFLKVDPGIAKLIGVLNMQSLPKRLSGDFRDLFGEGFAFDSIDGHLRIERGIARTEDLRTRGLQAQVTIRGEADLARETQRLNVEVVPEMNAGLASLALGAMVNPVIGLGTFAAQYVLRKPLQAVLSYDIDVTGSWSDPTVSERNRRVAPVTPATSP
jgi:uncharacterized protein (TIGR02099 family)